MAYEGTKLTTLELGPILDNSTLGELGEVKVVQVGSFTASSTTAVDLFTLPEGSRVLDVVSITAATGANAGVNIGTSDTADYFADELSADVRSSAVAEGSANTGIGLVTGEALTVQGIVGDTAASSGTVTIAVEYTLVPASIVNPSSY